MVGSGFINIYQDAAMFSVNSNQALVGNDIGRSPNKVLNI